MNIKRSLITSFEKNVQYLAQLQPVMPRATRIKIHVYSVSSLKYAGAKCSEETLFLSFFSA